LIHWNLIGILIIWNQQAKKDSHISVLHTYKSKLVTPVQKILPVLEKVNIIPDLHPLNDITNNIEIYKKGTVLYWKLSMYKLKFRHTDEIHNYRPTNIKYIFIVMNVVLEGRVDKNSGILNNLEYLDLMNVDIEIIGIDQHEKRHLACWHIDKHIITEGDNSPIDIHPMFHIHFGGKKLQDQIDRTGNFGDILLLNPPRSQFPPLDIPLSIDFVLSNFYGEYRQEIINDSLYKSVIKESQANYWKPYYCSIARHWEKTLARNINPLSLIPNLIK